MSTTEIQENNKDWRLERDGGGDFTAKELIIDDSQIYLNSYVSNHLPQMTKTDEKGQYIKPESTANAGGKGRNKVEYSVIISTDENTPQWAKQLSPFDVAMLYCSCSIWLNGNDIIYPDVLYSQWTNGNRLRQNGDTREMIAESLLKLSSIRLDYDYTQEIKRKYPTFTAKATVEGHIIELSPATIEKSGHKIKAFRILTEPPILTHARSLGQIITVKKDLLTINDVHHYQEWDDHQALYIEKKELLTSVTQTTPERALVRDYLIKRIQEYKNYIAKFTTITSGKRKAGEDKKKPQPKPFNKIILETMFTELEITDPSRKSKLKSYVIDCMDNFELKEIIKNYSTEKNNGIKVVIFDV
jgi:hypothetical protein